MTLSAANSYSVERAGAFSVRAASPEFKPGNPPGGKLRFFLVSRTPDSSILVTGAGIVSPLGLDWRENEASFRADRACFRPVTLFDVSERIAKTAASVDLPSESLFLKMPGRRAHLVDRGTRMVMLAVREALGMAGLSGLQGVDAIVLGTSAGAMSVGQEYFRVARSSPGRQAGQLSRLEYYQPQRQIALIADEYDWRGPVILISNACASGANAIGEAMALIRSGRARRVLAGGYDALAELVFAGFDTLRALAPSGIPRPFDAARDGLALGEGAAVVLLESADAAAERGAEALAVAAGYATATDLHHLTQPDPEGKAAIRTMREACAMAGVRPEEIGYLNSHGTGTPFNDVAEASAIRAWAGEALAGIPVSSTKSAMGHLLGGAGAVEAVICLMAMRGGWLPGSLHVREVDECVGFDLVRGFRQTNVRAALTNSFGFGGTNATLVFTAESRAGSGSQGRAPAAAAARVLGAGAVSPAGWSLAETLQAVRDKTVLPVVDCPRSLGTRDWECPARRVPAMPADRLPKSPRLRRASPVTKFAMAAALEALDQGGFPLGKGAGRLGIVVAMFNGCVQFSGRFYHEVIETPTLASPLIFPETVYNAPASHIAAALGADGPVSTLIGESSVIAEAVLLARLWLEQGLVEHCLVIGAEEADWLGTEATSYYHPGLIAGEGAAALLLGPDTGTGPRLFSLRSASFIGEAERAAVLARLARALADPAPPALLVDGASGIPVLDSPEAAALDGPELAPGARLHPRSVLGETMGAAGALQLALAAALARESHAASVLLPGSLCGAHALRVEPGCG